MTPLTPYWTIENVVCYHGDVLETLAGLPDRLVQTVCTSVPYYLLRDYQTGTWKGGEAECDHLMPLPGGTQSSGLKERSSQENIERNVKVRQQQYAQVCGKCGAIRIDKQIGLEADLGEYIQKLVAVFSEVRRVLRDDGVVWLNVGDTHCSDRSAGPRDEGAKNIVGHMPGQIPKGLKPKDLMLVPQRLAIALQEAGWWVRQNVIWEKGNCLPESCQDRPTTSHEYILLLAKSESYFYDSWAIREPQTGNAHSRGQGITPKSADNEQRYVRAKESWHKATAAYTEVPGGRNCRSVWKINSKAFKGAHFAVFPPKLVERCIKAGSSAYGSCSSCGTPWVRLLEKETIPGEWSPYEGKNGDLDKQEKGNRILGNMQKGRKAGLDHDNPFPKVQSVGWRPGCGCGLPEGRPNDWEVIRTPRGKDTGEDPTFQTGRKGLDNPRSGLECRAITRYEQRMYAKQLKKNPHRKEMEAEAGIDAFKHYLRTDLAGARPIPPDLMDTWIERMWLDRVNLPDYTPPPVRPCVVLDPFGGSGTSALVARHLGRAAILIDLSQAYCDMAQKRLCTESLEPKVRRSRKPRPVQPDQGILKLEE